MDPARMLLWFAIAYLGVTVIGVAHTYFNWLVRGIENETPVRTVYDIEAYSRTVPFHPLYNIVLWPVAAYMSLGPALEDWQQLVLTGVIWCLLAIVVDMVGWVLIPHPWSMTWKEMFVDYQPWISLIYASILVSPLLAAAIHRLS